MPDRCRVVSVIPVGYALTLSLPYPHPARASSRDVPPPPRVISRLAFRCVRAKAEVIAVPTEFDTLLDYQKVLSRLVLKETLAGLQQGLGNKDSQSTVPVAGSVSMFFVFCFCVPASASYSGLWRCKVRSYSWVLVDAFASKNYILGIAIVKRHFLAKRARAAVGRTAGAWT